MDFKIGDYFFLPSNYIMDDEDSSFYAEIDPTCSSICKIEYNSDVKRDADIKLYGSILVIVFQDLQVGLEFTHFYLLTEHSS